MMKTVPSPILSLGAIIFGTFSMQHGLSHAQCLDTEALLQVSYNDASSWKDREFVNIRVANSSTMGSTDIEYTRTDLPSNATFTFEKCFPRDDTCGHISVTGPPMELYSISWDGQVVGESDPELPATYTLYDWDIDSFVTMVQFGDACVLECSSSDEALFDFQLRIAGVRYDSSISSMEYFVEDQNGNQITSLFYGDTWQDPALTTKAGLYVKRMCLPKNDCYRLVMRDRFESDNIHVAISFDDKNIFDGEKPYYFTSIKFGNGCPGEGLCDPDTESRVQFFMSNYDYLNSRPITWHLTNYDVDSNPQKIYTGTEYTNTSITLHHNEICVPKESCLTFSFEEQQEIKETTYPHFEYMVTMDDIVYRKYVYYEWRADEKLHTFHLGDCAAKLSSICNPDNETLLELNFKTKSRPISSAIQFPDSWYSFWGVFGFGKEENEEGKTVEVAQETLFTTSDFPTTDYEYDSAYRVIKCIPNVKCVYRLAVENNNGTSPYESYSIKVNDTVSTAETILEPELYGENIYVTAIDSDCNLNSGLSGGAIAGITVASVVVVGALIAVFVIKKRKA